MGAGNDTVNLYTGSTTGALDGGAGSDTIHLEGAGSGSLSNVSNFESLKVDGGTWSINGSQTYSGGVTIANGATAVVSGTLTADVTNNGTVSVQGGSAAFGGNFVNNGAYLSDPSTQTFTNLTVIRPAIFMPRAAMSIRSMAISRTTAQASCGTR